MITIPHPNSEGVAQVWQPLARATLPRSVLRCAPSNPARWEISDFNDRLIKSDNLVEADDGGNFHDDIAALQKLPSVIIGLVTEVENRNSVENNGTW